MENCGCQEEPHEYTEEEINFGKVWLMAEIEKEEPRLREPLTCVTYLRDMPIKRDDPQSLERHNWSNILKINLKDILKWAVWQKEAKEHPEQFQGAEGEDGQLEDCLHPLRRLLDAGIRMNWNEMLDQISYQGYDGTPGLVNLPGVKVQQAQLPWDGGTSLKSIMKDFESVILESISDCHYCDSAVHFLIPPKKYAFLAVTQSYAASNFSKLDVLLTELPKFISYWAKFKNEMDILDAAGGRKFRGTQIHVYPSGWCIGAGAGGSDRMVAYVAEPEKIYLDIPAMITRIMTTINKKENEVYFLTLYAAKIGSVKPLYYQCIKYLDGI